jgi:hypothetical protein
VTKPRNGAAWRAIFAPSIAIKKPFAVPALFRVNAC